MLQRIAAGELSERDKRLYRREFINLAKASDEAMARNDYAIFKSLFKDFNDLHDLHDNVIEANANEGNAKESDPFIRPIEKEPEESESEKSGWSSDEVGNDGGGDGGN
ncbi:LOW QUALITY PROTEIN: hypothetical protein IFM46972_08312 [Aspergillus udagawae]|uniref:Uncharacterized protein n=1 Tax=Aspergillus udagawae TaxID=91492 RepID=A0A8H3S072_9EURO|nr:LOW QUALITY PROTEIN: hypothetical protein IFM46972_08312 [Aspergillus udagawae]